MTVAAEPKPKPTTGAPMRKTPKRSDSRERVRMILAEAINLLETHELGEISIGMIARTAGISRTTLYDFFPTTAAIFERIARDYVRESHVWVRKEIKKTAPHDMVSLINASVEATCTYLNCHGGARKTLFGTTTLELHMVETDWDVIAAEMYREFISPDWPVEPLSPEDPFRTMALIMSAIYLASVRRSDHITPAMAEETKLASIGYMERREQAFQILAHEK